MTNHKILKSMSKQELIKEVKLLEQQLLEFEVRSDVLKELVLELISTK